ncbi:MAG: DUF2974 domain-containing protein [Termitinemataceae bacterium]|nr:MAG: DUF2974 domain-containing protein [Termitinemataceae bacterium]
MANVFDYLYWRGDLSFKAAPFNPVDNIIFSIVSYLPLDNVVSGSDDPLPLPIAMKMLQEKEKKHPNIKRNYIFKDDETKIIGSLLNADRYKSVVLHSYINKIDNLRKMQFSAVVINSPICPAYIAFRGTDLTIAGWQEDFNMIFDKAIPAQIEAAKYLQHASLTVRGKFNIGGHSKGGNLAIYAASFCTNAVQKRIANIYSNDSPGFSKEIVVQKEYKAIENRICTFIPQDSIVGLLFEHQKKYFVVQCDGIGFDQHNPFLWHITKDNFERAPSITKYSKFLNKNLMDWLNGMNQTTRQHFINTLFGILNTTNVKSVPDFTDNWLENSALLLKSMRDLDKSTKDMLNKTFAAFVSVVVRNVRKTIISKVDAKKSEVVSKIK